MKDDRPVLVVGGLDPQRDGKAIEAAKVSGVGPDHVVAGQFDRFSDHAIDRPVGSFRLLFEIQ